MKLTVLAAGAACLLLASCTETPTMNAPKPCKHATVEACNADPLCAWDKNHDPAKSRCKTKEKAGTMEGSSPDGKQ